MDEPLNRRIFSWWGIFFAVCTAFMVVCMAIPSAFGLQNFNAWGGIFFSVACDVRLVGTDGTKTHFNLSKSRATQVWLTPASNASTCLAWAAAICKREQAKNPGRIDHAEVTFRRAPLVHDACTADTRSWF